MRELKDLPNELLELILFYLSKPDLFSARLACSLLNRLGARFMFERIYLAFQKARIETFLNVAKDPIFAKSAKEVVYDARLFDRALAKNVLMYKAAFDDYILTAGAIRNNRRDLQNVLPKDSHSSYPTHCAEQQALNLDGDGGQLALSEGLRLMPKSAGFPYSTTLKARTTLRSNGLATFGDRSRAVKSLETQYLLPHSSSQIQKRTSA